ncbi:Ig-like domain-containing protein [Empedobacter falsenii]
MNNLYKWLWGDSPNEFGVRDLGYYIGYQIAENYYNQAENKKYAIKELIELDYANNTVIEDYVTKSNYFSKSLEELQKDFESKRPTVLGIKQFNNYSKNVDPKTKEITINFSEPLNGFNTGVDYGELGEVAFSKSDFKKRYWSNDNKSWTIQVELEPNKKYQILISSNFRNMNNYPLKNYLIEFETSN